MRTIRRKNMPAVVSPIGAAFLPGRRLHFLISSLGPKLLQLSYWNDQFRETALQAHHHVLANVNGRKTGVLRVTGTGREFPSQNLKVFRHAIFTSHPGSDLSARDFRQALDGPKDRDETAMIEHDNVYYFRLTSL
jgi:hypothetical protein